MTASTTGGQIRSAFRVNTKTDAAKYNEKGVSSYNLGRYANATMYFKKAIEIYEKFNDKKKLALLWNSKGMALESLGAHLENQSNQFTHVEADTVQPYFSDVYALECFETAIHFASDIADADVANIYLNQGYTYAKMEMYEKAIKCFDNADEHFKKVKDADATDIADTYRNKGYAIAKTNYFAEVPDPESYKEAKDWLKKSTNLCPKFALAWNTEGYIHTMFERYKEARKCFAKAIEIDPDFSRAWRNYGYVCYCIQQEEQLTKENLDPDEIDENAKYDNVMEYLSRAIELDPQDPYAWHYRGCIYFLKKEYDNALRDYEKAIQVRSSFYDAWYGKGIVFDSKEQYQEAIKCYSVSIELCSSLVKKVNKVNANQKIVECKKLASMHIKKGISLESFAKQLAEKREEFFLKDIENYMVPTEESLQEAEVSLQKTEEALQEAEVSLQKTEEALQEAEVSLQKTEEALQEAEVSLQKTEEAFKKFKNSTVVADKIKKAIDYYKLAAIFEFQKSIRKYNCIRNIFREKIEIDVEMGLAYHHIGNSIGDLAAERHIGNSITDIDKEEIKRSYVAAIKYFEMSVTCFKNKKESLDESKPKLDYRYYTNKTRLYNRHITNALRCQGFVHARLAELCEDNESKRHHHMKAFNHFEKSTEEEGRESSFALAWNSRGYHIIGFLEDLECAFKDNKEEKLTIEEKEFFNGSFKIENLIKEAEGFFDKAIKYGRLMPLKYQAWFYYNKGYALYKSAQKKYEAKEDANKDFENAANCFKETLIRISDDPDAWLLRAICLYYGKHYEARTDVYSEVIKFLDNSIDLYKNAEIKAELVKSTANEDKVNNKNFAYAWYYKGILFESLKRYQEAVKCFDECTNLSTDLDLFGEAWYRKGVSFYLIQNYEHALKCLEEAKRYYTKRDNGKNDIKYIELCLALSESMYESGNLRDAKTELDIIRVIIENKYKKTELENTYDNIFPETSVEKRHKEVLSQTYLVLGLINYSKGDLGEAEEMYDKAKKLNGRNLAEVYYNLAILHSTRNENEQARKSLVQVLYNSSNDDKELKWKAKEALTKYGESKHSDWYQWWLGRSKGKKIGGIILIVALVSAVIAPLIIIDRAIVHLISSNSTDFAALIPNSFTAQTVAAFTIAVGALLAILLLPSLQKFRVATIELETIPISAKDQETMILQQLSLRISPPRKNEMPLKITSPAFQMPLIYENQKQVYTPAATKYKKVLLYPKDTKTRAAE